MIRIAAVVSLLLVSGLANAASTSVNIPITVTPAGGSVINATDYCAANGGGNGTSGSPWQAACIQAAVNSASAGDTIYLAGGNWALSTAAPYVAIAKTVNLLGAGSGNTFDAYGHVNNASGSDLCPTSGTSITCIYSSGTTYAWCTLPSGKGGYIQYGARADCTTAPSSQVASCANVTISHIFFDNSLVTSGGASVGLLNFQYCPGPILVDDIRFLAWNNAGLIATQTGFFPSLTNNLTVQNSVFADPISGIDVNGNYPNAQVFQENEGSGHIIKNNVFYQNSFNPIYQDSEIFVGNASYDYQDAHGVTSIIPAMGPASCSLGNRCFANGGTEGNFHFTAANNLFYSNNAAWAIGGGINDPGTSGAFSDLNYTGNWIIAPGASIAACVWQGIGGCTGTYPPPSNTVGMQLNVQVDASCNPSSSGYNFNIMNNSLIGSNDSGLDLQATGSTSCKTPPNTGTEISLPLQVRNSIAQKNYLQSPSNRYATSANTINATQSNNFCSPAAGGFTGCSTSGFATIPTCSFAAGTLSGSTLPITSTSFTSQYGAVQYITSTSSPTPNSGDSRWNKTGIVAGATGGINSYLPPVSLSPVGHGNTVYMWVMDSVNHVAACGSYLVP